MEYTREVEIVLHCHSCHRPIQAEALFCQWCGVAMEVKQKRQSGENATGLLLEQSLLQQGRYVIVETVGKGGMGAVYKALDLQFQQRIVAIKEMSQQGLKGQDLQKAQVAFAREAELLAGLKHPSLPHIYEQFAECERRYLVMEFIVGETLEQRLTAMRQQGQRLTLAQIIAIAQQLCNVLDYLHHQHPAVIFRDLKPANIMLDAQDRVFLIDFGIARLFKPGQNKDTSALGSPGYAPPEQYRSATSPRSDIYSLGATLHYLLTDDDPSQTPFAFRPFTIPNQPQLARFILSMVELEEKRRPTSIRVVQQTLQQVHKPSSVPVQTQTRTLATAIPGSSASTYRPFIIRVILSPHSEDHQLWQVIYTQLQTLLSDFPRLQIQTYDISHPERDAHANLYLLLLSDDFLASTPCMNVTRAVLAHALALHLRPYTSTTPISNLLASVKIIPAEAIAHKSLYAQEQHILEAAKILRRQLILLLLRGRTKGDMNLLHWLLWQLYGDGLAICRYFTSGHYTLKHISQSGLAAINLQLLDRQHESRGKLYLIGPVYCDDLKQLLQIIAPLTMDPEQIYGTATHYLPH
ncbi:serine/threonine protein kinase [Ktedonobacteria bacterium brp13]|nr:serine/threonine protein kinase [Ktedonobacteria bacterium brp13]